MNTRTAQRYVLISILGLLVINTYRGKLTTADIGFTKRMWGTGVLAIVLGLVSDVAPQVAGPFAVLVLVGSLTSGGDKALHNFLGKLGGTATGSTTSKGTSSSTATSTATFSSSTATGATP